MNNKIQNERLVVIGVFLVAFFAGPYAQLAHLSIMPGNIIDARLNNYFLENIYQFFKGGVPSLIHLNFFYPFTYVGGFSDNLFGAAPVYLIARTLTLPSDTAFQIWFLTGYLANYIAAYIALRQLEASRIAAAVGALIFTFSLPCTSQIAHAQLIYRFAFPLSISAFILFLNKMDSRYLPISAAWLVWQFYCSIYIGFFSVLLLLAISFIYTVSLLAQRSVRLKFKEFVDHWTSLPSKTQYQLIFTLLILAILFGLLFYPYLQVNVQYGFRRQWDEIAMMLPRPQSYFLSDISRIWSFDFWGSANIPMRYEHQMFIGIIPLLLSLVGVFFGSRRLNGSAHLLLAGSLAILIVLTLSVNGLSLWQFFYNLPLFSSIRAVSRIILILLFPVAFLSALAIDKLTSMVRWGNSILFMLIIPLLLVEFSAVEFSVASFQVSPKVVWREMLHSAELKIDETLPKNAVLFYAQTNKSSFANELDAMWVSLNRGLVTLNGYSGNYPPGFAAVYGTDCSELSNRIQAYIKFHAGKDQAMSITDLAKRVVPIGFLGCNLDRFQKESISASTRLYTADEFKALSFEYAGRQAKTGGWNVTLNIVNHGSQSISAISIIDKPVRLSWRLINAAGEPLTGWDTRKDLPFDVPANGSLSITIPIDTKSAQGAKALEVTLVQEFVFWGHDIGLVPLLIDWAQ